VVQSGGTGRAGRDGKSRVEAGLAGAGHAYQVRAGRAEAIRGRTAGPGRAVAVKAGRAVVGWCELDGSAGWSRSVELVGRAGCSGCGQTAAGRSGRVGPVGGTERVREDGRMSGGRAWQVATGWGHVGCIMWGLGVHIGL